MSISEFLNKNRIFRINKNEEGLKTREKVK